PVPTAALAGVDVTIAVNLLGRQALPAWPGEPGPERTVRDRDPVIESLELASFGAAAAQTAAASVPVTPPFGPGTWRDFRHADRKLAAGEEAIEQALSPDFYHHHEVSRAVSRWPAGLLLQSLEIVH